ncbi:PAS domain S-box protein [Caldimonas brevitalea]|uniref:histidine kinase n=1 Tax=Caldimonas brevitalea TaxID=413882 RepID=A0A0G3BV41_9BURK|nr:PAS domain S-box protein [Caldimonas brevitalea]AKJ31888.1 diguanylate cyclase [Caldimonas brevitalea]
MSNKSRCVGPLEAADTMASANDLPHVVQEILDGLEVRFAGRHDRCPLFGPALEGLIGATGSRQGLIAEVGSLQHGSPQRLRTIIVTDLAWPQATRLCYDDLQADGAALLQLTDEVRATSAVPDHEPVVATGRGGRPYLGFPLRFAERLIGVLALSGRSGGYAEPLLTDLRPFVVSLSYLLYRFLTRTSATAEAAQQQERRLGTIVEHMRDVVCIYSPQGIYEYVSPSARLVLGYTHQALVGRRALELVHVDDRRKLQRGMARLGDDARQQPLVLHRFRHADGRWIWLETLLAPLLDSDAALNGVLSVSRDMTSRVMAEEKARAQHLLLHKLSQHVPGVLFQYQQGPDGKKSMPYASAGLADLCGLSPRAVRKSTRSLCPRVHPEDLPLVERQLECSAAQLAAWAGTFRTTASDGQERWVAVNAAPERLRDDGVLWHGYAVDITERRELLQQQLTMKAAQHASAAKTAFLARMSHELRTPLNAVIGFAQLLDMSLQKTGHDTHRGYARNILDAGRHVLSVLSDVLELSTIEAGGMSLSIEATHVLSVVKEAVVIASAEAARRSVDVKVALGDVDAFVSADRTRLRQVIVNLISNAIKYNRPGGAVTLLLELSEHEVALHVQDTGRGMSPEQLSRLYQPFNRLGVGAEVEGTGIGLVITRNLVELMFGRLTVVSTAGVGSTFTVHLKRLQDGPSQDREPLQEMVAAPDDQGQHVVLYVEDNDVNVLLLKEVLRYRPAVRLLTACSGAQALELLHREVPDLLLLDMHLGDTTGMALLNVIRKDARMTDVPCVAVSADGMPEQVRSALRGGFTDYLVKPVDVQQVLKCLDRHLSAARSHDNGAAENGGH